jgi:hypothetical protein
LRQTIHENPVAAGAVALAIGAVVGFSLPRTQAEDSFMGAARDQFVRQTGEAAASAAEAIVHATERTAERAKKSLEGSLTNNGE